MVAAMGGHEECVRMLLDNNADIKTTDNEGWTVLHYAASSGNEAVVNDLLDQKDLSSSRRSRRGHSPLDVAVRSGKAGTAGFLLDKDASVIHQSDSEGFTPLHLAIESGFTSVVEELISLGADLNQASNDGQTPLHTAIRLCNCKKRQVEMTEALDQIQQESDDILSPSEALIQFLINKGSKKDIKDNGYFPAQYAKVECIKQMAFHR
ncbi:putative ankyrin repeat protein RF_0381 [Lytechinus variegatus]|uniref:putative ankyrin repeat protein RF_0381 n=1 Tax=Lytechinus variegatus TaxID=7654 RepID=UPI001BB2566A|nr:putative ankyrin repeat protein RF_0381 [Lytechinus variegatus]